MQIIKSKKAWMSLCFIASKNWPSEVKLNVVFSTWDGHGGFHWDKKLALASQVTLSEKSQKDEACFLKRW